MFYSGDPVKDFENYDRYQQKKLDRLPKCHECDYPIQDDECYEINGELICEGCLNENHRKRTDDYVE